MLNRVQSLPYRVRLVLLLVTHLGVWAAFSLPPLFAFDPASFQAAGSIVVAAGILIVGIPRIQLEKSLRESDRAAIIAAINRLEAFRKLSDERTKVTFDLYLMQISQLLLMVGAPNPIGPKDEDEIQALQDTINEQTGGKLTRPLPEEQWAAEQAIDDFTRTKDEIGPWTSVFWRAEIVFIVIGTLQWGYGDRWVRSIATILGWSKI